MELLKSEKKKPSLIKREIHGRSWRLYNIFVFFGILFIVRILYVQYSSMGEALRARSDEEVNFRTSTVHSRRGSIMSHDEKILATSVPTHHLYMDFKSEALDTLNFDNNVDELSRKLSDFYQDRSAQEYYDLLTTARKEKKGYLKVSPYRVNSLKIKEALSFPVYREGRYKGGRRIDTIYNRSLPYGDLAKRTIGELKEDGRGAGLERSLDSILRGSDGVSRYEKITGNFWVPIESEVNTPAINGIDVVTTLDIELQDLAEMMLRKQVVENSASWGTAILMEVGSGEVRALANIGRRQDGSYGDIYNYAIGQNMEPGSTFKIVSLLAILEDKGISINKVIDCGSGTARVGAATVRDSHRGGFGSVTVGRMFEVSSNIGFARTIYESYKNNPDGFTDFIESRNFHKPFDFAILGERSPMIRRSSSAGWSGASLPMMAFGYEVLMTPLHTLALYNAIANNGVYVKPKIVNSYMKDGVVVEQIPIDTLHPQVASEKIISQVRHTMEQVVNDGTAKVLLNPYYKVAGKTGTAQVSKPGKGYHYDGGRNYLATMVGYFPAENPKYCCIVAIELFHRDGTSMPYYGGVVSGPVFRALADKVYSQAVDWGNKTDRPEAYYAKRANQPTKTTTKKEQPIMVKVGGDKSLAAITKELQMSSSDIGKTIYADSTRQSNPKKIEQGVVPNVKGMGLRDAVYAINSAGFKVKHNGKGRVVSQHPTPNDTTSSKYINIILK